MRRMWCGVIVVAGLALSGCADPGELLAEKAAEKIIEQQLSDDDTSVDINADGEGGMTIEGEDGTYKSGAHAEVPDDFPSELPLPDGELISSATIDGTWVLNYQNATRADFDKLSAFFEGGDFERTNTIEMEGMISYIYSGAQWSITLGMMGEEGDEAGLSYMVATVTS